MSISHSVRYCFLLIALAACGDDSMPAPDAAPPSTIPTSAAGTFALTSTLDMPVPAAATPAIAALTAATDDPDDPTRYVVEQLIAELPEGTAKSIAGAVAPYVAAYVNARLEAIAPRLAGGLDGLATGLTRVATHLVTVETLQVDASGNGVRTISALRFDVGGTSKTVPLSEAGLASLAAGVRVVLDATGEIAISEHEHALPYGAILRLGLDRAVAPSVQPGALDLSSALAGLVDCDRLGAAIAECVGLGSAGAYGVACRAAVTALAAQVDAQLAAIDQTPLGIEVAGTATGFDSDHDGAMDELRAGRWTGAVVAGANRQLIDAASFSGSAAR